MRIHLTSVFVDDQEKALRFYTGALGFVKKHDVPLGEARWLTVVSPEAPRAPNCSWSPTATPPSSRTRRRWSTTASPPPPSPWTT